MLIPKSNWQDVYAMRRNSYSGCAYGDCYGSVVDTVADVGDEVVDDAKAQQKTDWLPWVMLGAGVALMLSSMWKR